MYYRPKYSIYNKETVEMVSQFRQFVLLFFVMDESMILYHMLTYCLIQVSIRLIHYTVNQKFHLKKPALKSKFTQLLYLNSQTKNNLQIHTNLASKNVTVCFHLKQNQIAIKTQFCCEIYESRYSISHFYFLLNKLLIFP